MSKQLNLYKAGENVHRRTYSNNLDQFKGIQPGHRRTMSNTAFDFAGFHIQYPPAAKEEPLTPEPLESPTKATNTKKKKGFLSLLNASVTYFNQEAQFPISFPPSEIDVLKEHLEKLRGKYREIEKSNEKLSGECESLKKNLDDQHKTKRNLENSINELKKYTQQLENNMKKLSFEIKQEQKSHEDLQAYAKQQDKRKVSPQGNFDGKIKKKTSDIDKPMPRPITYKPITQRGIRNSREVSRK